MIISIVTAVVGLSLSLSAAAQTKPSLEENICGVIKFAKENGSDITYEDLFHCHVVTGQNGLDATDDMKKIGQDYDGLLCHAHEYDGKRTFKKGEDNTNIVMARSGKPIYLGLPQTAYAPHLAQSKSIAVSEKSHPKLSNQVDFFKLRSPQCGFFKHYQILKCDGNSYCYGSDESFDNMKALSTLQRQDSTTGTSTK